MKQPPFVLMTKEEYEQLRQENFDFILAQFKPQREKWVCGKTAMKTLNCGISFLQKLRNQDKVAYSRLSSKNYMYRYDSLIQLLDENQVF